MSYELTFERLGRGKASGKVVVKELNYKELNRVFSKFYRSELEFITDEAAGKGTICFGWHTQDFKIRKIEDDESKTQN